MPTPPADPTADSSAALIVGIDLGTTNSAVAWTDPSGETITPRPVRQLLAVGERGDAPVLPSFLFFPPEDAADPIVGTAARDLGRLRPGRLVASSKSWLCHPGVDRSAAILPWHGEADCPRVSPVEAAAAILRHIAEDWDRDRPPLAEQEVVITLPASFDQVARELTVRAAQKAGLPRVVLIEEPQAAFYAWMHRHPDWADRVRPGQTVLVCDIGGGTSDFSLIAARELKDGRVDFQRRAVGEHLLLGGDNLDAALASHLERPFEAAHGALSPADFGALVRQCRLLKEQLLAEDCTESLTLALPSRGSRLVASTRTLTVDRDELRRVLLDGFLPACDRDAVPEDRQSGFQEFGLPYAADPAITRHLAAFLARSGGQDGPVRPDHVLFNGGFFASPLLRDRLLEIVGSWLGRPGVLDADDLFGAVAFGAACYGRSRRGLSTRIAAGLPRSFYVGIGPGDDGQEQAVCIAPAGLEPDDPVTIEQPQFTLTLSQPVEFPIYSSAVRLDDAAGSVVVVAPDQMTPLPPIRTVLKGAAKTGHTVVRIESGVTEIGTLQLGCRDVESGKRWRLQFDVRSATQTDRPGHVGTGEAAGIIDEDTLAAARNVVADFPDAVKPKRLMDTLEQTLELPRNEWPPVLLRTIWEAAMALPDAARSRPGVESRWLHLVGFALRPGYGVALDDWRAGQTYKRLHNRLKQSHSVDAARILWRRIGGGLTGGQQSALAQPLLTQLDDGRLHLPGQSEAEAWRMLASFERLAPPIRTRLLRAVAGRLAEDSPLTPALWWAAARLLTRVPAYGPLDCVLPAAVVEEVRPAVEAGLSRLAGDVSANASTPASTRASTDASPAPASSAPASADRSATPLPRSLVELAAVQLGRLTGDRFRDLPAASRESLAAGLEAAGTDSDLVALLRTGGSLPSEQQTLAMGDALPPGLRLAG